MFCITVDAQGRRRIKPHYILLRCERRCAPFVWMQDVSPGLIRSFALPPAAKPSFPPSTHTQMQKLPPQQAGKQQVHTYPPYSSTEGLEVRPEKQLHKYGWLASPKAVPPMRTETLIISTSHYHLSLSVLFPHINIGGHSQSFPFSSNPIALSSAPSARFQRACQGFHCCRLQMRFSR